MCEISLGSATGNEIIGHTPPAAVIADIQSGKWAKAIAALRSATGDEAKRLKKLLPAILWAGTFTTRKNDGIEKFSGFLCADIDKVQDRIGELHDIARSDPPAVAAFVSPSGTGIKIVFCVPVAADAKQHRQTFNAVRAHVAGIYQAQVDEAAKDIARLCFVSHDPAAFFNADAVPLALVPEEAKTERARVPAAKVQPSTRTQIAEGILGAIQWTDEGEFCKCPGEHLHTAANGSKDCMVKLDGAPTIKCFHNSCLGIVAGVNRELRSQIGKAEFEPDSNYRNGAAHDAQPNNDDPLPGNDDEPHNEHTNGSTRPDDKTPVSKSLGELKRRTADDPNELLRTGYLCRGGGLLLAASTGIGKSSFAIQSQIMFALGRAMFGIQPVRPLRSLYIQAENDEGDLAEMRDGVLAGHRLSPSELETVCSSIITAHANTRTGRAFMESTVAPLLELHRPDLLWIDPALSFIGTDAMTQKDVGYFLRNLLNPLLTKFNCGCVVIHHTNKPSKGEEKGAWQAGDFAYLGSGSAEWANWARAVLAIRSVGSHDVFELRAGKRGGRIGWKDEEGKTAFARLIGHATEPGVICWRPATEDETPATATKRAGTREDLTALVPLEKPIAKSLLIDQWKDRYGNHAKGRAFLDALTADGKLFEWRLNRAGTNAAKLIARKPQTANAE